MKRHELEAYLLASRPTNAAYSPFTQSVMDAIRLSASEPASEGRPAIWQRLQAYVRYSALRKAVALVLVIIGTAFVGFGGYAYAQGTNPFSLIKRWISGEQVKVIYQDSQTSQQREFSHGAKRTYSDIAISAFAEVSLIDQLHFHADHAYTVPKNGIEHITDPFRTDFIAPRVGTIEQVTQESVVLHLTYSMGRSKLERSQDIDERITIPRASFYYYEAAKQSAVQPSLVGKLVEVFQDQYLQHRQHSGEQPTPVDLYSAFALSYPFAAVKEATMTNGPIRATNDEELAQAISQHDIFELGGGAWAEVCMNNGADSCPHASRNDDGQNFFAASITPGTYGGSSPYNPGVIATGEAVLTPTAATKQYMLRHIEGKIAKISGDSITLKTSSGVLWTFQYAAERQQAFARLYGSPLKVGQLLAGGVLASVYDWDRRDFDNQYVFMMSRYTQ